MTAPDTLSTPPASVAMPWPDGVRRVAAALQVVDAPPMPRMLAQEARTAQAAADQLGVALGQIAKSVMFRREADDASVLVVTAGDQRVDESKLACLLGPVGRADALFVKAHSGFAIGGVAPVGHLQPPLSVLDASLQRFDVLWAAAGHPRALVALTPGVLEALTGAPWADVIVSD